MLSETIWHQKFGLVSNYARVPSYKMGD